MPVQFIHKKAAGTESSPTSIGDDSTGKAIIRNLSRAAGLAYDRSANFFKYNGNDAIKTLVDAESAQSITGVKTLTAPVLTTPTISSPVLSGAGVMQVAVVNLDGATWHTGNGVADFLNWTAPAAVVIARVVVNISTKSNGAATADIGTSVVNSATNGDNLLDALDIGSAAICASNFVLAAIDTEKAQVALASGGFVNFHALADPTGAVGKAYIYYFTL